LINCTEISKFWLAAMLSPFWGDVKTEETMLLALGIFPMAAKVSCCSECGNYGMTYGYRYMNHPGFALHW
jgi:hypothetical protein